MVDGTNMAAISKRIKKKIMYDKRLLKLKKKANKSAARELGMIFVLCEWGITHMKMDFDTYNKLDWYLFRCRLEEAKKKVRNAT